MLKVYRTQDLNKIVRNRNKIKLEKSLHQLHKWQHNFMRNILKTIKYVTKDMHSLAKDQLCFLTDLLPPSPPIPKATQIQCDEGDNKLALRLAIADYHMAQTRP